MLPEERASLITWVLPILKISKPLPAQRFMPFQIFCAGVFSLLLDASNVELFLHPLQELRDLDERCILYSTLIM